MHRKMIRWVAASCFALALTACGPEDTSAEETPAPVAEVEQGIGSTPLCLSTYEIKGWVEGKTVWNAGCGICATYAGGGFGHPGNYYERCCQQNLTTGVVTCDSSWKLIKPVCGVCEPE